MADSRIDELRKRLEKEPGSRLFAQLAEELRKAGELSEAIRVCRDGLQKQPTYHSARMTLARAFLDSGDLNAARPEFEAVLKAAPDNILASRLLGECLEGLGDLAGARARYKTTLAFTPMDKQVQGRLEAVETRLAAPPPPVPPPVPAEAVHAPEPAHAPPSALEVHQEAGLEEDFKPIPLVAAEESFELEATYEAPATRIGSEAPAASPAEPAGTTDAEQPPDAEAEFVDFEAVAPYQPPPIIEVPSRVPLVAEPPEVASAPPGAATPAAPAPEPKEVPTELASPTLAELYFGQGHTSRAIEIYRQVVEREPANERSRARLTELVALERHLATVPEQPAPPSPPSGSAPASNEARREALWRTIRHLEEMLAAVRKG